MSLWVWNNKTSIFSVGGGIINLGTVWKDGFWPEKNDDKREPLESTIAYYPLLNDVWEVTWKSSWTNTWVTITTLNWVKCWYFNWSSRIETNISSFTNINHTLACWVKRNWGDSAWLICANPCWVFAWDVIYPNAGWTKYTYQSYYSSSWGGFSIPSNDLNQSDWHCVIFSWWKLYIDWTLQDSWSWSYNWWYIYTIWWHTTNSSCSRKFFTWYMWDVVIDNSAWTDVQISAYYNKTRNRYVS